MSDQDEQGAPRLRVDRLAAAMDAARARARAAAETPGSETVPGRPADPPSVAPRGLPQSRRSIPARGHDQSRPPFVSDGDGGSGQIAPAPDIAAGVATRSEPASESLPRAAGHPTADAVGRNTDPSGPATAPMPTDPLLLTEDFPPLDRDDESASGNRASAAPADRQSSSPVAVAVPVAPRSVAGSALLSLVDVATDIGRYRVLQGMGFDVPKGAVTMLLGRNGVGKTTTLRTVMGLWRARAGEIVLAGDRIDRWPPHRIARAGVGYVPETMCIFDDLTVAENIALGARSGPVPPDRLDWLTGLFPPLATFWRSPAGNLSGGQKQMLALARALVEKRRLYLIDEPTKGLAPAIVHTVVAALRDLKLQGATILMVEQNFAVARALGDACVVMDDGRVTWSGPMGDLADDPTLQASLMGLNLGDVA